MIFCLVIRGLTLPGAIDGLIYYVTPDFNRLFSSQVWMDAGTQVFYSYAICFGCQIALGSYNKYHRNFMKDCITLYNPRFSNFPPALCRTSKWRFHNSVRYGGRCKVEVGN